MVITFSSAIQSRRGSLIVELLVAIAMLVGALLPVAYAFSSEHRLARAYYQRAIAMEIVDGEIEVLAAGQWRAFNPGEQSYSVRSAAAANLPAGRFVLTVETNKVRLEWRPEAHHEGGNIAREFIVK